MGEAKFFIEEWADFDGMREFGNEALAFQCLYLRATEIITEGFIPPAEMFMKESLRYRKQGDPILVVLIVVSFIRVQQIAEGRALLHARPPRRRLSAHDRILRGWTRRHAG